MCLENPYKLDKQLAALDQVLSDYPRSSKRQRIEVIFHYYCQIFNFIYKEPESEAESDADLQDPEFEPSYDSPSSPVKTDYDSESESDSE